MPEELGFIIVTEFGTSVTALGSVAALVGYAAASYAVSALLAPGDKSGRTNRNEIGSQTIAGFDPAAPWQVVYGETRKSGNYVFRLVRNAEGDNIETFHLPQDGAVITVAAAASFIDVVSVEYIYQVNEEDPQWLDYPGTYTVVNGVFTFDPADNNYSIRIRYRAFNSLTRYLHSVMVLAAHEVQAINTIYLDDQPVQIDANGAAIGNYAGYLQVYKHLGVPSEPADTQLRAFLPDTWTAEHTLEGHAYIYVLMIKTGTTDPWATGIPNISVVLQGRNKIYDPRSGTYGYTDNAALVVADYLANTQWGMSARYGDEIDNAALIAAANACDETVPLKAGGTEKRYTINGVVDTGELPRDVLPRLVAAMAGRCVYVGGKWRIHAGVYTPPVLTLTEKDFRDSVRVTTRLSRREVFNAVKGTFLSPANKWQLADFPAVTSNAYALEDGGEPIYKNVELRYTNSASMAQRLARIDLLRARQQIGAELPMKLTAYGAQPPDNVALTLGPTGWTAKVFELAELKLSLGVTPGVDYVVRETAANIYDWDVNLELTADPAPNTALASPWSAAAPGAPVVSEQITEAFGLPPRVRARITWSPSPDAQAQAYALQWQKAGEVAWQEVTGLSTAMYELLDVEAARYFFRVAATNSFGIQSAWASSDYTFMGLTAPPADVTGFVVAKVAGLAFATWDMSVEGDVIFGGALVVRHTPDVITPVWEDGIIYETFAGNSVSGMLPLVSGTYMAKWRDAMGKYSNTAAVFAVTEGMLGSFTTVATSTQASGFTGAKTNITLDGGLGGIRLTTVAGSGEYLFDTHMDLTTVATRRFEADIVTLAYALSLLFDSHSGQFDDGGDFDGDTNINECDATLYARTTDDNPAGSPTWGAWTPFFVSDFTCRALQFKLVLTSTSAGHNIVCTTLTVHAKVPV